MESSAPPDQATTSIDSAVKIDSIVQIDPPAVVSGAGLVAAAPATVPKTGVGVRGGTVQSRRLLFEDLVRGGSVYVDVDTEARYITPVAGAADKERLAVLLRTCSDGVAGSFVQCADEAFGVVVSDRTVDAKAGMLPLPVRDATDTYRGLAVDGDRLTTVRVSTQQGMAGGSFDASEPPVARLDVLVSSGGEAFRPVAGIDSTGIEPCVTADGAVWSIDAASGLVSRFDPSSGAWAAVPALAAEPLSSLACGADRVAILDSAAHRLSLIDIASISEAVPLRVPDSVWGAGLVAGVTTTVRFDAVTSSPFVAVPAGASPEIQLVRWDGDGVPGDTVSLPPGFASWLPFANGSFWRTAGDREAEIITVDAT